MALKIRLRQQCRTNRTMYRLVVTDVHHVSPEVVRVETERRVLRQAKAAAKRKKPKA